LRGIKPILVTWLVAAAVTLAAAQADECPAFAASPQAGGGQGRGPAFGRGEGHHAGAWLRKYLTLPPAEQEKALASDPEFQKLPPETQQRLRERLQKFNQLPPEQQQKILARMEKWQQLTPEQRQQARALFHRMRDLPPERRHALVTAYRHLRDLDPPEQQKVLDSEQFKSTFSDDERDILRGFVGLGVGPGEHEGRGPRRADRLRPPPSPQGPPQ
jgi:hypothetical protein